MIFLQDTVFLQGDLFPEILLGPLIAFAAAFLLLFLILIAAIYIYMSLAYSAIARKAKHKSPNLAWIPIVGPLLITSKIANMHWWPILLLVLTPVPIINGIAFIVICIFSIIWVWKTYDKIGKPGWWALFNIIQPVGLVFLGIAAWSKK